MTDLTMSQFASKDDLLAAQAARIAELESQLDAIGAGGVEPLRKPAAAQQAEPFMWAIQEPGGSAYMDENCVSTSRGIVEAEVDGLNLGLDADDEPYKVVPAYLAAAPQAVHPAEGVANEDEAFEKWWSTPHVWGLGHKAAQRSAFAAGVAHAAATQPAAQGMEAADSLDAARLDYLQTGVTVELLGSHGASIHRWKFRIGGLHASVHHDLRTAIDAALAAQAKQGGAA